MKTTKPKRRSGIQHDLQPQLERRIALYVAAAAGVIASVPSAAAQVIYTKADLKLNEGLLSVDLNHDGISEIKFRDFQFYGTRQDVFATLSANPGANSSVAVLTPHFAGSASSVAAVSYGFPVGPNSPKSFVNVRPNMRMAVGYLGYYSARTYGNWVGQVDKFVGLRFKIQGQTHYGWMRLTVHAGSPSLPLKGSSVILKITGYAYEATADKGIAAGDRGPSDGAQAAGSLGRLSLGAATSKQSQ